MLKKKPMHRNRNDQTNKKALIWIGIVFVIVMIIMAVLLYFNF